MPNEDQKKCACENGPGAIGFDDFARLTEEQISGGLACADCLGKHIAKAAVLAREWEEEQNGRGIEFWFAVGNLACAEDHARALGKADFAASIRAARRKLQGGDAAQAISLIEQLAALPAKDPR